MKDGEDILRIKNKNTKEDKKVFTMKNLKTNNVGLAINMVI